MIIKPDDIKAVSALFDGWEKPLVYSCLEGTMGEIYSTHDGLSAMATINDFAFSPALLRRACGVQARKTAAALS